MKKIKFLASLSFIMIFCKCKDCESFTSKDNKAFKQVKILYTKDSLLFKNFTLTLNKYLEKINDSYSSSEYYTWSMDSLNKIQNLEDRKDIKVFFESNKISNAKIESNTVIFFYPKTETNTVDYKGDCPGFSYEIVYLKNNIKPKSNDYFEWHKIADYWFIRTSMNSL